MRIKCLAQEHNAVPRPVRPDPESSALNIKPLRLPTRQGGEKQLNRGKLY